MEPEQALGAAGESSGESDRDPGYTRAFAESQPDLIRFLTRRLRCLFTARDLAQEVYLRVARVAGDGPIRNPRAFFFQVAANLATDYRRVENRRLELLREVHHVLWSEADRRSPERQLEGQEELAAVRQAIRELPDMSRRIFSMNRFEGLTQREIAERLGISSTAVEKHIRKVLARLSEAKEGVRGTPIREKNK
ncbi:MAG: RNA polymerase sigma factor [Gammaproteobacteria bacterium]